MLIQETADKLNVFINKTWPTSIHYCNLTNLNVYSSGINKIPEEIGGLHNLELIFINDNNIKSLRKSFSNLKKIIHILRTGMKLQKLQILFSNMLTFSLLDLIIIIYLVFLQNKLPYNTYRFTLKQ